MGKRQKRPSKSIFLIKVIKENPIFFIAFLIFLIAGAISLIMLPTGYWIEWFSNRRTSSLNNFFRYFTRMGEAIPYIAGIIILLFIKFKHALLIPITGVLVTIISFGSKAIFLHDRPSVYFEKLGKLDDLVKVDGINLLTGQSSFPSGHTMSGFAIYALLAFFLSKQKWLELPLFLFAFLVGISRIYLMQHFLKDVYSGAIFGVAIAIFLYWLQSKWVLRPDHFLERSLLRQKSLQKA